MDLQTKTTRLANRLLERIILDDGIENEIACRKFVNAVKGWGSKGSVLFVDDSSYRGNPLLFTLANKNEEISELKQQVKELETQVQQYMRSSHSPKKTKTMAFPWDLYPELELRAFEMRFREKASVEDIRCYIEKFAPEAKGNKTFLNQRFIHGSPSASFNIVVKPANDGSKTTWEELWKIGTAKHSTEWIRRIMREGGGGQAIFKGKNIDKDWPRINPNDFIDQNGRKKLRRMYHNDEFLPAGKELEAIIMNSGVSGITEDELKKMGVDQRRLELKNTSVFFSDKSSGTVRWIHSNFAADYPNNIDAKVALVKYKNVA